MRKKLGVLHEFQLFKYARHFTVLAGREGQEKSVVPKGKNEIKDSGTTVTIFPPKRFA